MKPKALTIWQPYALLLVLGLKRFETRGWYTTYRGPLVIHAAKKFDAAIVDDIARVRRLVQSLDELPGRFGWTTAQRNLADTPWNSPQLFGRALGIVQLHDCRPMPQAPNEFENSVGHYGPGRVGWECVQPIAFDAPIEATGRQGIWTPDATICRAVSSVMDRERMPA